IKLTKEDEADSVDSSKYQEVVKHIFRYIRGTSQLGLWYLKGTRIEAIVYADSDHAGDYVNHKITSGVCTFMGYCLTSWFAKKQTAVAISTTEAEYVSAENACQQALWMKALIDYGIRLDDVPIISGYEEAFWVRRKNLAGKISGSGGGRRLAGVLEMMEHDSGACICGALVSVNTNDIFSNNEFLIFDVGRKIISKDNGKDTIKLNGFELINDVIAKGERGFNVSSFMNEAISTSFEGAFEIV
nr:retrovirus-related Pol polyprotein from transposon TNT 1-94 [Tanacetum cinerariifolium]